MAGVSAAVRDWTRSLRTLGAAYTTTADRNGLIPQGTEIVHAEERSRLRGYRPTADHSTGWDLTPAELEENEARWRAGRWTAGRQDGNPIPVDRWPASWHRARLLEAGRAFVEGRARLLAGAPEVTGPRPSTPGRRRDRPDPAQTTIFDHLPNPTGEQAA